MLNNINTVTIGINIICKIKVDFSDDAREDLDELLEKIEEGRSPDWIIEKVRASVSEALQDYPEIVLEKHNKNLGEPEAEEELNFDEI